jgi:hypothetical protein
LYSWEVVPSLYPPQSVPRRPRFSWRRLASIALAAAAVVAGASAGILAIDGLTADEPTHYAVTGTVWEGHGNGAATPLGGAEVVLWTDDNRTRLETSTFTNGEFSFGNVPNGGITLNITDSCCAATLVYLFASRSYSTATTGLNVVLHPGATGNVSSDVLTPFPDLATFLAYVGGAAVLLAAAAIVAGVAALAVRRPGGAVLGVLGGGASVAVPAIVVLFSLGTALPVVSALAGVSGGLGAFVVVLSAADLASGGAGKGSGGP